MCINPRIHPDGLRTPCHHCWQCKENRINDWVGRCIAEKETAVHTSVATLTYGGGDVPQSRFLRKSDMSAYIKAIRNEGHKVRYFYVGEYGSLKGRAHWHCVLFWETEPPPVPLRQNINDQFWPHGFSLWDNGDTAGIRYVMKYIAKDTRDAAQLRAPGMSKKPLLGTAFFEGLARRYVEAGLAPQRPFYKFRDVVDKRGNVIEFYMPPLVRDRFIAMYIARWQVDRPGEHWPVSELVDSYHDRMASFVPPLRHDKRKVRDRPWLPPPGGAAEQFDEKLNSFYCVVDGERLFWSFDDEGQRTWAKKIVSESEAERRQLAASGRRDRLGK